jgi:hypothetical protein
MGQKHTLDDNKDEVIRLYNSGKSLLYLQDTYHADRHTVSGRLKLWGVTVVPSNTRYCGSNSKNWKGCGQISSRYFSQIRNNAKTRNLEFDITLEELWEKFQEQGGRCAISGVGLTLTGNSRSHRTNREDTASVDRIDSLKGYTKDNIQWVHKDINLMRNKLGMAEFIEWCNKIANHNRTEGV